jgi:SAM-dependent methyltransferase
MGNQIRIAHGEAEDFRRVREFLPASGFTAPAAAERLGLSDLNDFTDEFACDREKRDVNLRIADSLGVLVRLFLSGVYVPAAEVESHIPEPPLGAMVRLGLLVRFNNRFYSSVLLYQVRGLYIVSDRLTHPDGSSFENDREFVFLALTQNTESLLRMLPTTPCRRFLDIGAGTGVAALLAARDTGAEAWGVDIVPRSVFYAEFNRRLNGIENATMACGDLYKPVNGAFDRIGTHPPYVWTIASAHRPIFADGGEDGEQLVRRIVQGLPQHLEPGGRFYCLAMVSDRTDRSIEQRVRQWLGETEGEFDVAVVARETQTPMEYAMANMMQSSHPERLAQWKALIARHGITTLTYGYLVLQRAAAPRAVFNVRRQMGAESGSQELDWLLSWETAATDPDFLSGLLQSKPRPAPSLEMTVTHHVGERGLAPAQYRLRVDHPFTAELQCRQWLAYLVSRCDGARTGAEHLAHLIEKEALGEGAEEQLIRALSALVSGGFLYLEGWEPPARG